MGSDNARIAVAIGDWIVNLSAIAVQFPEAIQAALGMKTQCFICLARWSPS